MLIASCKRTEEQHGSLTLFLLLVSVLFLVPYQPYFSLPADEQHEEVRPKRSLASVTYLCINFCIYSLPPLLSWLRVQSRQLCLTLTGIGEKCPVR